MWECIRRALFVFSTRNPDTCLPHLCCILITSVLSYIWPRVVVFALLFVWCFMGIVSFVIIIALIVMICGGILLKGVKSIDEINVIYAANA